MRIVVDESVFAPDHVPHRLPHREEQLRQLESHMGEWVKEPGSYYPRLTLVGRPGSGKTATIRRFWKNYQQSSKAIYIYINGFIYRNFVAIINEIARIMGIPFPRRGLSRDEFLSLFAEQLVGRNIYFLLVLDDAFNIQPDILSIFIRLGQEVERLGSHRMALLLVGHSELLLNSLDHSTRGIMGKSIVRFPPYTKDQIFDILLDRAQAGLRPGSYDEELLEMIADITGAQGPSDVAKGDARLAIDILYRAAYLAEQRGRQRIEPDDVRRSSKEVLFGISEEVLKGLPLHEKLLLLSIVRSLKSSGRPYVTFGEVEENYRITCEEFSQKPRVHSQLWTYLVDLRDKGVLETRHNRRGEGLRGRTTLISIGSEPLDTLEIVLTTLVKQELR